MYDDIENGMVLDMERMDRETPDDHWNEDRDAETLDAFIDGDMAAEIIREWLGVTGGDDSKLADIYDMLRKSEQEELAVAYVEAHGLEQKFNEWYEER